MNFSLSISALKSAGKISMYYVFICFLNCLLIFFSVLQNPPFIKLHKKPHKMHEMPNEFIQKHEKLKWLWPWGQTIRYWNLQKSNSCHVKYSASALKHFILEKIYSVVILPSKKLQFIYFSFVRNFMQYNLIGSSEGSVCTSDYTPMAGWQYGFEYSG